ncbi:hypothetical protein CASFOL_012645 [Castilleja foliolosa]|uniref:Uncharacterized protein n=1 Tax=Castilleja foliolosa TaxID=1961234 RepID=A0ABD3DLT4_9LAMI
MELKNMKMASLVRFLAIAFVILMFMITYATAAVPSQNVLLILANHQENAGSGKTLLIRAIGL